MKARTWTNCICEMLRTYISFESEIDEVNKEKQQVERMEEQNKLDIGQVGLKVFTVHSAGFI